MAIAIGRRISIETVGLTFSIVIIPVEAAHRVIHGLDDLAMNA
jgi:hypothetical protein